MRVVHVSTADSGGGAFRAAFRLHTGLRRLDVDSKMLVLKSASGDANVVALKPRHDFIARRLRAHRAWRIHRDYHKNDPIPPGVELFSDDRSPYHELVDLLPRHDLINLHWIGGLVDWRSFFKTISIHTPLVWRLADMGALTGGCHYDQGCGKFAMQCGACPQLGSKTENDLSRQVWTRRKNALSHHSVHVVGPSQWIAGEAKKSSLLGKFPISVIPNGLDIDEFAPRDKNFCRDLWSIPRNAKVVLFASESLTNVRKGFKHLADAVAGLGQIDNLLLVSVGGGKCELPTNVRHLALGKVNNDRMLSTIYSAADVFVIPSLQESFGQTVIESLACGTPVVGFASGGIPDMVRPGQTGWLATTGDTQSLRDAIFAALSDDRARIAMAANCRRIAVDEYSMNVQAVAYVKLYETLLKRSVSPVLAPGHLNPAQNAPPQAAG